MYCCRVRASLPYVLQSAGKALAPFFVAEAKATANQYNEAVTQLKYAAVDTISWRDDADSFDRFYMAELALGRATAISVKESCIYGATICGASVRLHVMRIKIRR